MRFWKTLAALALMCGGAASAQQMRFFQIDWFQTGGVPAQLNSVWGRVTVQYPPPLQTQYLNIVLSTNPVSPVWVVRNYPLRLNDNCNPAVRLEAIDFDLSLLGFSPGQNVTNLFMNAQVTPIPVASYSGPPVQTAVFFNWTERGYDSILECPVPGPFLNPGAPEGHAAGAAPAVAARPVRDMNGVQEGDSKCCAGSMARSLDWLNRKNSLGFERTAQEIYDDLVAAGVSVPVAGLPKSREKWIQAKDQYAKQKSGNQITTSVWDGGAFVDPIPGIGESTGDFLDWLNAAWDANKDIEIAYYYPGNAHIITVVDVYKQDGKTFVKYRDDDKQDDNAAGDTTIKEAEVYKGADGKWHFGSDENVIYFAVAEECTKTASVLPDDYISLEGSIFGGSVASVGASDDSYLSLLNDDTTLGCVGLFSGTSPIQLAETITFTLETQATRPGLALLGSAYMCQPDSFFDVFGLVGPTTDTQNVRSFPAAMAWRFVNPMTGEMRFRVSWVPINDEDPSQDGWVLLVDQFGWTVGG